VRLPYADFELSMRVLLPKDAASNPVDFLDPRVLDEARTEATTKNVQLALPKWDFQSDLAGLADTLQRLGMFEVFTPGADLSALSDADLHVTDVIHRSDITVDEEGTEAAAVSGIAAGVSAVAPDVRMTVDHPFACAVVDEASGAPLFEGVVRDPTV